MKYYRSEKFWIEWLTVVPLAIALGFYFYGSSFYSSLESFLSRTLILVIIGTIISVLNHLVRFYALYYFHKLNQWTVRITLSLIAYLIVSLGISLLAFKLFSFFPFLVVTEEKKNISLLVTIFITIIGAILYEANTYYHQWKSAIAEEEQLEKLNLESQFQSLQGQLNPHFLFNSFNVLSSLIHENPIKAEQFVDEMSNVYRYLMRTNNEELATVQDEIKFAQSFSHLIKTRYEQGIDLNIYVSKEHFGYHIPSLSLQLLLENAIKHNEINPNQPLQVDIYSTHKALIIENNLQPKTKGVFSNKIGLENLSQRYHLLNREGFSVIKENNTFKVTLPFIIK